MYLQEKRGVKFWLRRELKEFFIYIIILLSFVITSLQVFKNSGICQSYFSTLT